MARRPLPALAAPLTTVALLAAITAAFWGHRMYIDRPAGHGYGDSDMVRFHHPLAIYLHEELRRGRLPVWNPYQLAGEPLLATQSAALLYPPGVLLRAALPPARGLEVHALLHLVIAGFGMSLLTGRLGLGAPARLAASLAFMLSGPVLRLLYQVPCLSTVVWTPMMLWAALGLIREGRVPWAGALAVVSSLAFLGGYAQGFVYQAQLTIVFAVVGLVLWVPPRERWRRVALGGGSVALWTGLVAGQLLPTLELAGQGTRSFTGVTPRQAALASIGPAELVRGLLGLAPETADTMSRDFYQHWNVASVSVLVLPLLLCGLAARSLRPHWAFFGSITAAAGAFMLGPATPVFRTYYALPFGNLFRVPTRMGVIYACAAAVVAGIGVQGAMAALGRRQVRGSLVTATGMLLAIGVGLDMYRRSALPFLHPALEPAGPRAPAELLDRIGRTPEEQRTFVAEGGVLGVKLGMMHRRFVVPTYSDMLPGAYTRYFMGADHPLWHGNQVWRPDTGPLIPQRLLDLMSVRYYAIDHTRHAAPQMLELLAGRPGEAVGPVHLVERPEAAPRAYVVHRALHEPDAQWARRLLTNRGFDPRAMAVVDRPVPGLAPKVRMGSDSATIARYSEHAVTVTATCRSACLVVLTDLHYPGWEATVDGHPTEMYRANMLFRAVRVDRGTHRIEFRYRPWSVRLGLLATCGTLGLLVVAVVFLSLVRSARA
jgi:uncharacterized membrane protein